MGHMLKRLNLALIIWAFVGVVHAESESDWQYTVLQRDTVWGICKQYVSDPLCWKKLVDYNQIKNPKYIPPGTIIQIPKAWLIASDSTALVIAVEGSVLVTLNGKTDQVPLLVGDKLSVSDTVVTKAGSAMVEFSDGSRLVLKPFSTVKMETLQYYPNSNVAKTRIELIKGQLKALVEKQRGGNSAYEVVTPAAVAAVRGTEFRVANSVDEVSGLSKMKTELLTGALAMSSDQNAVSLKAGQAVMAEEGKGLGAVVDLLPRPTMNLNSQQAFELPLDFQWNPLEGAVGYKVALLKQGNLIWEKQVDEPQFLINDIAEGDFILLIRGIDGQGFEGRDRKLAISLEPNS